MTLTLKQAYVEKVRSDIQSALNRFGTTSPAYFKHVRELSLKSWLALDRTTMFDVDLRNQESRGGGE